MPEPIWGNQAIDEAGRIVDGELVHGFHGLESTWSNVVRDQGLPQKPGRNLNLRDHVQGINPSDTAFRGLGLIPGKGNNTMMRWPVDFAGENGLVLEINGVIGWDTKKHVPNATSQLSKAEAEIAIMSRVELDRIVQYGIVSLDRNGNEIIKPDHWKPNSWALS